MWDAGQYLKFAQERSRPFFDLLARVTRESVARAADLGCGAGNLTRVVAERWPAALVTGVDSSPDMLAQAQTQAMPGRLAFVQGDIARWQPDAPLDLLVSNAAFQWVGDHAGLVPRLAGMLAPGGTLAVQMPFITDMPGRRVMAEVAASPRWRDRCAGIGLSSDSVQPLDWYVRRLLDLGCTVDAWETTYVHVLTGPNPVLEWMKGTALRPFIDRLGPDAPAFLDDVAAGFRAAYPPHQGVTLFPFPRIFFVAQRHLPHV